MANTSILAAFERMWLHVLAALGGKADTNHTHNYAASESEGGAANSAYVKEPVVTAGTGAAYTATVPGITALTKGVSFVMVPHAVSTTTQPTLNVNGLGAKGIRRRLSNISTTVQNGYSNNWLGKEQPFTVTYNGTYWIVEGNIKTAAVDLYGQVGIANGGTGATTAEAARANLGIISVQVARGSWDGAGSSRTVTCGFKPDVVFITTASIGAIGDYTQGTKVWETSKPWMGTWEEEEYEMLYATDTGFVVNDPNSAMHEFTQVDYTYYYLAVKFG